MIHRALLILLIATGISTATADYDLHIEILGLNDNGTLVAWQEKVTDGKKESSRIVIAKTVDLETYPHLKKTYYEYFLKPIILEIYTFKVGDLSDLGYLSAQKRLKALAIKERGQLSLKKDVYGEYGKIRTRKSLLVYLKIDPSKLFYRLEIYSEVDGISSCKFLSNPLLYDPAKPFNIKLVEAWLSSDRIRCLVVVNEDYYSDGHKRIDRIYAITTYMTIGFAE
jgi:hypothetical protein